MRKCPIVITGPIGAGKSTVCNLLSKYLSCDYITEYIDQKGGPEMLEKLKSGIIPNEDFQEYVLGTFNRQLQESKSKVIVIERLPEEGSFIFGGGDKTVLRRAIEIQEIFGIQGSSGKMKVVTIINHGQGPLDVLNEILISIFGTNTVTNEDFEHFAQSTGVVVYLKTTPATCIERIKIRNRGPEQSITLNDMAQMCNTYEKYISSFNRG
ncbi:hypothetical protein TVAG_353990 [Trichomonas vaginalis G3]|uniref:Deoxynucleoside kinase domain-containing protein n=1 Tax=Trichomonas vaginalis (strain ATCC PRA-98 / G3) TaxID=412133 RepID=A2FH19_TRIV3|nr:deoxynucleoside kinase family [Trichomonas vaginalis G3]EAX95787.1 hypothetical protein TVAG_353990 [Trichomonas vaginalis G3]KAI5536543.1 deoxynucleoside kinase family [Trichomonas vaginalis G3]|eukprot:XP_001308717.1 hypothetical protein [Trichomonas vaginalis G3]